MDQTQGKGLSHTDYTHTLPQVWALGQRHGFAPWGSRPIAKSDVWKREQEGGREEARPGSLPSLPLPVLCKHNVFTVSSGGQKTPPARA